MLLLYDGGSTKNERTMNVSRARAEIFLFRLRRLMPPNNPSARIRETWTKYFSPPRQPVYLRRSVERQDVDVLEEDWHIRPRIRATALTAVCYFAVALSRLKVQITKVTSSSHVSCWVFPAISDSRAKVRVRFLQIL